MILTVPGPLVLAPKAQSAMPHADGWQEALGKADAVTGSSSAQRAPSYHLDTQTPPSISNP